MKLNEETVEGRPNLNVDWEAELQKQRKGRLVDAIYEHLDDTVSADEFRQTILDTITESIDYHQKRIDVARSYIDAMSSIR